MDLERSGPIPLPLSDAPTTKEIVDRMPPLLLSAEHQKQVGAADSISTIQDNEVAVYFPPDDGREALQAEMGLACQEIHDRAAQARDSKEIPAEARASAASEGLIEVDNIPWHNSVEDADKRRDDAAEARTVGDLIPVPPGVTGAELAEAEASAEPAAVLSESDMF